MARKRPNPASVALALRVLAGLRGEVYAVTGKLGWPVTYRVADHLAALGYARKHKNGRYSITVAGCRLLKVSGLYFMTGRRRARHVLVSAYNGSLG